MRSVPPLSQGHHLVLKPRSDPVSNIQADTFAAYLLPGCSCRSEMVFDIKERRVTLNESMIVKSTQTIT